MFTDAPPVSEAPNCDRCGDTMVRKYSTYGKYLERWACPNYPSCAGSTQGMIPVAGTETDSLPLQPKRRKAFREPTAQVPSARVYLSNKQVMALMVSNLVELENPNRKEAISDAIKFAEMVLQEAGI